MPNLNQNFSHLLLEKLRLSGISHFTVCPGSRNTPLSLAVAENKTVEKAVFFDERAAAFYALGIAKSIKKPTCLIVTSGTAVANLFPAVIEAYESKVPLLLLTADRPQRLKKTQANQTIDQEKFFGSYVHFYANIEVNETYLPVHLSQLVYQTTYLLQKPLPGPCHLNLCFEEPLFEQDFSLSAVPESISVVALEEKPLLSPISLLWKEKGLILIGEEEKENLPYILELAEKLNWPVIGDILSQLKTLPKHPNVIDYTEEFFSCCLAPEMVLHFGERWVSKKLFSILQKMPPSFYAHIYPYPTFYNPYHLVTHRYSSTSKEFCLALETSFSSPNSWIQLWKEQEEKLSFCLKNLEEFCEPQLIAFLSSYFPKDSVLFLGNSLSIRHADRMMGNNPNLTTIYANRGASGIDGNIATCLGIAKGKMKKVIAILGDTTVLHDLSSLAFLQHSAYPIILLILNNSGGAIFDFLPVQKSKHIETYFKNPHLQTFEKLAEAFSLPYEKICSWEDLSRLEKILQNSRSCLIEAFTRKKEGKDFYQKIKSSSFFAKL